MIDGKSNGKPNNRRSRERPKAACSLCGKVGEVQAGPSGVTITCPEHGVYFKFVSEQKEMVAA